MGASCSFAVRRRSMASALRQLCAAYACLLAVGALLPSRVMGKLSLQERQWCYTEAEAESAGEYREMWNDGPLGPTTARALLSGAEAYSEISFSLSQNSFLLSGRSYASALNDPYDFAMASSYAWVPFSVDAPQLYHLDGCVSSSGGDPGNFLEVSLGTAEDPGALFSLTNSNRGMEVVSENFLLRPGIDYALQAWEWTQDASRPYSPASNTSYSLSLAPFPRLYGVVVGVNDGECIRGDLAAENIFSALAAHPAWARSEEGNSTEPILLNPGSLGGTGAVLGQLDQMGRYIGPQDTLVFYFAGHGGQDPFSSDERPDGCTNTMDEYVRLATELLTDDSLTLYFATMPEFSEVRKAFLLDSCHAGGFEGGNDLGDLEKLRNYLLIAAAGEESLAYADEVTGMPIFTWDILLPGLLSGDPIAELLNRIWLGRQEQEARYGGCLLPVLGEPGEWAEFSYEPYVAYSDDFDLDRGLVIPEPATLALLAAGGLGLLAHRPRRSA